MEGEPRPCAAVKGTQITVRDFLTDDISSLIRGCVSFFNTSGSWFFMCPLIRANCSEVVNLFAGREPLLQRCSSKEGL